MRSQNGFTMIEVMLVVGILVLISTASTLLFLSMQSNNQREVIVNEMISSLRKSQSRAMNGEDQSEFGVFFETNRYIEFKGTSFTEGQEGNVVNLLPAGVTIQNIDFYGADFVYFERMTGNANKDGSIDISVIGIAGAKRITINNMGIVNLEIID